MLSYTTPCKLPVSQYFTGIRIFGTTLLELWNRRQSCSMLMSSTLPWSYCRTFLEKLENRLS